MLEYGEKVNDGEPVPIDNSELLGCVSECSLQDMNFAGDFFTWCNRREGYQRTYCKLDRVLVNDAWLSVFPAASTIFSSNVISDHSSAVVTLAEPEVRRRSFKFCNMWVKHPDFFSIVQGAWQTPIDGHPMYILVKKLKAVKVQLQRMHKDYFSDIQKRIQDIQEELAECQSQISLDMRNLELHRKERQLQQKCMELLGAQAMLARQQAKVQWLSDNDRNTPYFHAKLKQKRVQNQILSIVNANGDRVSGSQNIQEVFLSYYTDLLGTEAESQDINLPMLTPQMGLTGEQETYLTSPVEATEVKEAIFSMGDEKAPGPDGFSAYFFKVCWSIIGSEVVNAVTDFFRTGKILRQINATNICLVPKVASPNLPSEFRPIACCNVVYKAITKIMANRLQTILPNIVSHHQSAFIKGRVIMSNILICQDLVRGYSRATGSPRCMMKIDLRKAYDSIQWRFIEYAMKFLGIPQQFVNWIMVCVSTAQYSVVLNGSSFGYFKGKRGIRQGDPISPYIFVMCMEILSRLLKTSSEEPKFKYHKHCKSLKLNHLFADDLMLFSYADKFSPVWLKGKLDVFSNLSGLHVNSSKSQIFLANAPLEVQNFLVSTLEFQVGKLPVRYLGVPLISSRLSISDCLPIVDKVRQRIASWTNRFLSFAGRVMLIKSILFHIQVYWSSIFILPKNTIETVDRLCRNFLWSGFADKQGLVPVAWSDICLPRREGGLGLKQLREWNSAAMGKLLWRIHCRAKDIWVDWIYNKLKGRSIWQINIPSDCAWTWRKLLQLRDVFKDFMCVRIGDGRECSLFYDYWLGDARLCDTIDCSPWNNYKTVQEWTREGEWAIPNSFKRRYPALAQAMIQVPLLPRADRSIWTGAGSDKYSIKDGYEVLRTKGQVVAWHNIVWSSGILPKQAFMLWLLFRRRLKTRDFLASRGLQIQDASCGLCNSLAESVEHVFFACPISKLCWESLLHEIGITKNGNIWSLELRWLLRNARKRSRRAKLIRICLATAVYGIWMERNSRVFRNETHTQQFLLNSMQASFAMLVNISSQNH